MKLKPAAAIGICLGAAALVGFFVSGSYAIQTFIGLDPRAFPAGSFLQRVGEAVLPELAVTLAGVVLLMGSLLLVVVGSFFFVRSSARSCRQVSRPRHGRFVRTSRSGALGAENTPP